MSCRAQSSSGVRPRRSTLGHRTSTHNDHVLAELRESFDTVLENLEALGDFSLARAQPGKVILGELGGIETGVRQMVRTQPLETTQAAVRGKRLTVPTAAEILRIKGWLVVSRNQTRDHVDVAALAEHVGVDDAAAVLSTMDAYYHEVNRRPEAVATQLARQLADPRPRDVAVTEQLHAYKGLARRWQDWAEVTEVLAAVAERMVAP